MKVAYVHRLVSFSQELRPERQVCLNVFIPIKLHPTGRFRGSCIRRQGRNAIWTGEHIEGLNSGTPDASHVDNFVTETLILEPNTGFGSTLFDNISPIPSFHVTIPHDSPVGGVDPLEVGSMPLARFEH